MTNTSRPCERGSSAVEIVLILPVIICLLLGAADYARVFYSAMAVTHAASVGAQYGAQSVEKSLDAAGMQSAATSAATDIPGFAATAVRSCTCWNASAGRAVFHTFVNYPGIPNSVTINRTARMRAQ